MPRVLLAVVSIVTAISLTGCSDGGTPDSAPAPEEPSTSTSATPSPTAPEPSTAPTSEPTAAPSSRPARPGAGEKTGALTPLVRTRADSHLLPAGQLPVVAANDWTVEASGPDGEDAVGGCQKTPLATIGAVEAVRRTYSAPGGLEATQVVARFADRRSAWRAHEVLVAWREDCEQRVKRAAVGALEPVTVRTGTAESYRASYARGRAAGLAILRTGTYLTVVEVAASGTAYPTRWDPARMAVRRIARTF